MQKTNKFLETEKQNLHPRNPHKSRYDFKALIESCEELAPYLILNLNGNESINFSNPAAVKALNKAILQNFYGLTYWDIPENYLCPPIPGRADYIHYMADLLAENNGEIIPKGDKINVLDIGMGANCIYPILGHMAYGWSFVGSEIDPLAIRSAKKIVSNNVFLIDAIDCRLQLSSKNIFKNIVKQGEYFDLTICNPPFHSSAEEALTGTQRKWKNLGFKKEFSSTLNFGGHTKELWCEGGEEAFINKMILESQNFSKQCFWFSTLVSKKEKLPAIYNTLKKINALEVKTIQMAQGQKVSRIVTWTFLDKNEKQEWRSEKWSNL